MDEKLNSILCKLDDSKEVLDSLILADTLSKENTYLSYSNKVDILKIKNQINELQIKNLLTHIKKKCSTLNSDIIKTYGFNKDFIKVMHDSYVTVCNDRVYVIPKNYQKNDFIKFEQIIEEVANKAMEMVKLIRNNNQWIDVFFINTTNKLNHKYNTNQFKFKMEYVNEFQNILKYNIAFHGLSYSKTIDTRQVITGDMLKELEKEILRFFPNQIDNKIIENIQKYIRDICVKHGLKPTKFTNIIKKSDHAFDFYHGYINQYINLEDDATLREFETGLIGQIAIIKYLAKSTKPLGDINMSLGNNYFIRLAETKEVGNDVYNIYNCKLGGKNLLQIYKNNRLLSGNQRRKAIRQLGYGREDYNKI